MNETTDPERIGQLMLRYREVSQEIARLEASLKTHTDLFSRVSHLFLNPRQPVFSILDDYAVRVSPAVGRPEDAIVLPVNLMADMHATLRSLEGLRERQHALASELREEGIADVSVLPAEQRSSGFTYVQSDGTVRH